MAKAITKKTTKKAQAKPVTVNTVLNINGTAVVSKVYYVSDKAERGSFTINELSPKGNVISTFVPFVWFKPSVELEEGDAVNFTAKLSNDKIKRKDGTEYYSLSLVIDNVTSVNESADEYVNIGDEIPFE